MNDSASYDKCIKVIDSCETIDHLDVGRTFIDYYYERNIDTEGYTKLLYRWRNKFIEIQKRIQND
jgi:hypothetical protein